VHLELSNLQTARGARFGPINGTVPNLFNPTGLLPGIKGFQVDMLVHALSDLGANEVENTPGSRPPGQLGGEESEQYRFR